MKDKTKENIAAAIIASLAIFGIAAMVSTSENATTFFGY